MAGDCKNAITSFRRALDVYPEGLGSLRNIAECEEELREYASARNDWWALRRAALQSNEAKYAGWEKHAEEGYNRLASKVARLTVKLKGDRLERVRITIDGKPLDPRLVGVELERDLGAHTVEANYGAVSPVMEKRMLVEGAREVVTLTIPDDKTVSGNALVTRPTDVSDRRPLKVGGFVALGAGVLSLAAAGVSLGIRQGALSSVETACPNYERQPCPASVSGDADKGATASMLVNVFGAIGIAGVGVGVTLVAIGYSGKSGPTTASTTRLLAFPAPGGGGARAEVSF
jgi:hypothetical protein